VGNEIKEFITGKEEISNKFSRLKTEAEQLSTKK
jgi:hypothetical protein